MTTEVSSTNTKVARMIQEYNLDGMGASLEAAWTGEAGERTSLRDLADEFNKAVLEAALREESVSSINVDVSSTYAALRGDSDSSATRARRRLEREEIDVDKLTGDFVTHQAIHTYLTQEREASLPAADDDMVDRKAETIEKLQGRTSVVAESAISSLANTGKLDKDNYDVLINVRAVCPDCSSDTAVGELIRQGGCGCTTESTSTNQN
jgi:hypothetical protein